MELTERWYLEKFDQLATMLVNGQPNDSISAWDRGLAYGDGVFRTLRVEHGTPIGWSRHYNKLRHDCDSLRITCPSSELLFTEVGALCEHKNDCVAKIIITRGNALRGYAPSDGQVSTRIISVSPTVKFDSSYSLSGVSAHRCTLKLGHQPQLAGIKHLNRLENVLAARECQEVGAPEGILEDEDGFLISGTRSNLFWISNSTLYTPDLKRCGVSGVQRERVIDWAIANEMAHKIVSIRMSELIDADEIFLVNSVIGLWPIRELPGYHRTIHPISWQIQKWLTDENH